MTATYPKDLFRTVRSSVIRASCFVLMPFESDFAGVYNEIRNTLQSPELNLVCRRADDFRRPHILETILTNIFRSEYIIADLTGLNPNVFYELGVAHCVKDAAKVVLLAQSIEAVPFDLRHLRCVVYDPTTYLFSGYPSACYVPQQAALPLIETSRASLDRLYAGVVGGLRSRSRRPGAGLFAVVALR